jgi:class 3 adenylate cyclase/tetratricopeptide (TPR) repeat protein
MRCPRCDAENPAGMKFCGQCAAPLASLCPSCGTANPPGNRFCGQCAVPLSKATEPRFGSPESYTPKHLAEKILASKSALEGERKQVTVLFADLKGSMELLADRDPEEARKLLDPVLERMMEAVHRYEGTVNQVMGDGIMALFGAPVAHEDHAVRACYAALRMQEAVRGYSEEARRAHGVNVQIRVGLNSGEVVVRAIGSDLRMDYTAVGQTTHLAARMEQLASPGGILLAPSTLHLVEGFVAVRSLGAVPVKGLAEPVEVHEVTGVGPARTRLQVAASRGLVRLVGRGDELEHLRRTLLRAGAGHGQVTAIVGAAGVGKSRLIHEFTRSRHVHGWRVLEAAAVPYGRSTTYLPVIALLRDYFAIGDRDDLRAIREKVTTQLLTLDRSLEALLPALLALIDVPVDDPGWRVLEPAQRRQATLDAVKRLLLREAREQPLLVVVEDLHWIDGETQAVLDALVDALASARLLLLVNYRPEYQHAWGSKSVYSQVRLDVLPSEMADELLDLLLGDDPSLASLRPLLVKRGNPFFLEETVRALVDSGALAGDRGRYQLVHPVQTIQVPPTVQVVLAARIDRLAPEDKRLLQTASVVGKDVSLALLRAIAGLPDDALHRALDRLRAAEFLVETGFYPDLTYAFKHALTHEVASASVLQERKRALHARIVDALEGLAPERRAEQVERLAHLARGAERWEEAVRYFRLAGAKAFDRSALAEAADAFEQALDAIGRLPETRERLEETVDLRLELRNAVWPIGRLDRTLDSLRGAQALAERLGDRRRLGEVLAHLAGYLVLTGDPQRAMETAGEVLTIASDVDDLGLRARADSILAWAHLTAGDFRGAVKTYGRAIATLEGPLAQERLARHSALAIGTYAFLVWALAELGEFEAARAPAEEAFRIANAANRPFGQLQASFGLGFLHLRRGEFARAIPVLERALEICRVSNLRALAFHGVAAFLGGSYAWSGRVGDAIALLDPVVAQTATMGAWFDHIIAIVPLGEAYLLAGNLDEARRLGKRAVDVCVAHRERGHHAWALRLLGEVAGAGPSADRAVAERHYRQALALANELGMRPLVAHCHLGLGRLDRRTGYPAEAEEHLSTAANMYREMEMTFWLEKAEAALEPPHGNSP